MDIAVIGASDHVQEVLRLGGELYPHLTLVPYSYERELETVPLTEMAQQQGHRIIFFTGPIPYFLAKEVVTVPSMYTPFNGAALYRGLFFLKGLVNLSRTSIDTIPRSDIIEVYKELGIPPERLQTYEYSSVVNKDVLVKFHLDKFQKKETEASLTCVRSVYEELVNHDVPCVRINPTRASIIASLERLQLMQEQIDLRAGGITYGLLKVDFTEKSEIGNTPLKRFLDDEVMQFDGFLIQQSLSEYQLFTTRKMMDRYTDNWTDFPLVRNFKCYGNVTVGMGTGNSITDASENARSAFEQAKLFGGNAAFVLFSNKVLRGPLPSKNPLQRKVTVVDAKRLNMAKRIHIDPTVLTKIITVIRSLEANEFTVADVAAQLKISQRRVRKIFESMSEGGLVSIVGTEQKFPAGRPRRLFRLTKSAIQADDV